MLKIFDPTKLNPAESKETSRLFYRLFSTAFRAYLFLAKNPSYIKKRASNPVPSGLYLLFSLCTRIYQWSEPSKSFLKPVRST